MIWKTVWPGWEKSTESSKKGKRVASHPPGEVGELSYFRNAAQGWKALKHERIMLGITLSAVPAKVYAMSSISQEPKDGGDIDCYPFVTAHYQTGKRKLRNRAVSDGINRKLRP